jgi:hypothetical protein
LLRVIAETEGFRHHQHARPLAGCAFVIGEESTQIHFAIAIIDRACFHW